MGASVERLDGGRVRRFVLPWTWAELVEGLRGDPAMRAALGRLLADAPFRAFAWETPPVTVDTLGQAFELVLVDDPALAAIRADPRAFRDVLAAAGPGGVASFPNLGGDAWLVAPCAPREPGALDAYGHLAAFVRGAPAEQQDALWAAVGAALQERVGAAPTWLSTAGHGVPWLHVRLDGRPKYYRHAPYRVPPAGGARGGASSGTTARP